MRTKKLSDVTTQGLADEKLSDVTTEYDLSETADLYLMESEFVKFQAEGSAVVLEHCKPTTASKFSCKRFGVLPEEKAEEILTEVSELMITEAESLKSDNPGFVDVLDVFLSNSLLVTLPMSLVAALFGGAEACLTASIVGTVLFASGARHQTKNCKIKSGRLVQQVAFAYDAVKKAGSDFNTPVLVETPNKVFKMFEKHFNETVKKHFRETVKLDENVRKNIEEISKTFGVQSNGKLSIGCTKAFKS